MRERHVTHGTSRSLAVVVGGWVFVQAVFGASSARAVVGPGHCLPLLPELTANALAGSEDVTYHIEQGTGPVKVLPGKSVTVNFAADRVLLRSGRLAVWLAWRGAEVTTPGLVVADVASQGLPFVVENRVEYRHGVATEWWVNGPLGLQHGVTLAHRPLGTDRAVVEFDVEAGSAIWQIDRGGKYATFSSSDGREALVYGPLAARDFSGRPLPARLSLVGKTMRIEVDDRDATYPIVIDPLVEKAELTTADNARTVGWAVATDGDVVVLGAPGGASGERAAYVFLKPLSDWSSTTSYNAKLVASDQASAGPNSGFGRAVAISGDVIVVADPLRREGSNDNQGAVYVFQRPSGGWSGTLTEAAKLFPSDGASYDYFGSSVDIQGDTVVVGATHDFPIGGRSGAVYVFEKPLSGWSGTLTENAIVQPPPGTGRDSFGHAVALFGNTIAVGAPYTAIGDRNFAGAVYLFVKPPGGWVSTASPNARLIASDGQAFDQLGRSVSADGDVVVAGAPFKPRGAEEDVGRAYVFVQPPGGWTGDILETASFTPAAADRSDLFGTAIAIRGDRLVAGAEHAGLGMEGDIGALYVFLKPPSGWQSGATANQAVYLPRRLVHSIAMAGDTLVAGSRTATIDGIWLKGVGTVVENAPLPPTNSVHGFSVLAAPGDGLARVKVGLGAAVQGGSVCGRVVAVARMGSLDGHAIATRRVRLGTSAVVNHLCVASGTPISLKPGAACLDGTDSSGTHILLTDCANAGDAADTRKQALLALPPDSSSGDVTLSADTVLDVTALGSNPIVDYASLKLRPDVTLAIRGNNATQTITIRIARNLLLGWGSRVVTEGLTAGPYGTGAERVLVLVGRKAILGNESVFEGTIFAEKKLAVGRMALVRGALLSRDGPMTFARGAVLTFKPWLGW